jgi:hypothetical protein
MIAAGQPIATAILEHDFGVLAGLVNAVHLDAGVTQDIERVSKRPTHF